MMGEGRGASFQEARGGRRWSQHSSWGTRSPPTSAPAAASAARLPELGGTLEEKANELNMVWVGLATVLVFLMQAGFMFLEIGFSRQKNAATGVAKVLVNLAIVTIAWWAIGYGVAEGGGNDFFGDTGFFFHFDQTVAGEAVTGETAMLMLYGLAFCAVSLAIVWGTTLERIKFGAYVIYAAVFGAIIYPLIAHAAVSYTHLRAHETDSYLVCRL